eukprot:3019137-Amphidinium_carterae.2
MQVFLTVAVEAVLDLQQQISVGVMVYLVRNTLEQLNVIQQGSVQRGLVDDAIVHGVPSWMGRYLTAPRAKSPSDPKSHPDAPHLQCSTE